MGETLEIPRCHWCDGSLPTKAKTGRPRRYCSDACRQRAFQSRRTRATLVGAPDVSDVPVPPAPSGGDYYARVVNEGYTTAGIFLHASLTAHPKLAPRFEIVGSGLKELLDDNFRGRDG